MHNCSLYNFVNKKNVIKWGRGMIEIRKETEADYLEAEAVARRAFYNRHRPGCNEHLLVHKLRTHKDYLPELSRIAVEDGHVVGLIMYAKSWIICEDKTVEVVTFGPLCADHKAKNTGIGKMLLEETIPLVKAAGYPGIVLFGEPYYYPKRGFRLGADYGLTDMEGNAWDSFLAMELIPGALKLPGSKFKESDVYEDLPDDELRAFDAKFEYLPLAIHPCQWTYENASEKDNGYHVELAEIHPRIYEKLYADYLTELLAMENKTLDSDYMQAITSMRSDVSMTSYALFVEKEPTGILVTSAPNEEVNAYGCSSYIEDLYVVPKYRGRGIASDVFTRFIRQQKKPTNLCVMKKNAPALKFWEDVINRNNFAYERKEYDAGRWIYTVSNR